MILQGIKLRKNTLLTYFAAVIIGFVFGVLLLFVTSVVFGAGIITDEDYTVATIGTMMSLLLFLVIYVFWGMGEFRNSFNQYIGFGMTRKKYFWQELFVSMLFVVMTLALIAVLYGMESMLLNISYFKQFDYEEIFSVTAQEIVISLACVVIAAPVLRMFLGSIMVYFGNSKGFWVLWFLWMIGCMMPGYVADVMSEGPKGAFQEIIYTVMQSLLRIPKAAWSAVGIFFLGAMLYISWRLIRKYPVQ